MLFINADDVLIIPLILYVYRNLFTILPIPNLQKFANAGQQSCFAIINLSSLVCKINQVTDAWHPPHLVAPIIRQKASYVAGHQRKTRLCILIN